MRGTTHIDVGNYSFGLSSCAFDSRRGRKQVNQSLENRISHPFESLPAFIEPTGLAGRGPENCTEPSSRIPACLRKAMKAVRLLRRNDGVPGLQLSLIFQRKLQQGVMSFDPKLLADVRPMVLNRAYTHIEDLCDLFARPILGHKPKNSKFSGSE